MSSVNPYNTALCVVIQTIRGKNKMSTLGCQRANVPQVDESSSVLRSTGCASIPALIEVMDVSPFGAGRNQQQLFNF